MQSLEIYLEGADHERAVAGILIAHAPVFVARAHVVGPASAVTRAKVGARRIHRCSKGDQQHGANISHRVGVGLI